MSVAWKSLSAHDFTLKSSAQMARPELIVLARTNSFFSIRVSVRVWYYFIFRDRYMKQRPNRCSLPCSAANSARDMHVICECKNVFSRVTFLSWLWFSSILIATTTYDRNLNKDPRAKSRCQVTKQGHTQRDEWRIRGQFHCHGYNRRPSGFSGSLSEEPKRSHTYEDETGRSSNCTLSCEYLLAL